MNLRKVLFFLVVPILASCGSEDSLLPEPSVVTGVGPVLIRINPLQAKRGDPVSLFGVGFSIEPQKNIIQVGGASTTATSYGLVAQPTEGQVEELHFTVPAGASLGTSAVVAIVFDQASNSDKILEIIP